jgi:hypothetical protein
LILLGRIAKSISSTHFFVFPDQSRQLPAPKSPNMSGEEDLIDYSDDELNNETAAPASNGKKGDAAAAAQNVDKKGSYVGIHSTGFRDFLLKPELLRAIADCGFEHPSEG